MKLLLCVGNLDIAREETEGDVIPLPELLNLVLRGVSVDRADHRDEGAQKSKSFSCHISK